MRSTCDQGGHEVVVPGGGLALTLEAGLQRGVGTGEVERDLAEQGQVPGGGMLAYAAGISCSARTTTSASILDSMRHSRWTTAQRSRRCSRQPTASWRPTSGSCSPGTSTSYSGARGRKAKLTREDRV